MNKKHSLEKHSSVGGKGRRAGKPPPTMPLAARSAAIPAVALTGHRARGRIGQEHHNQTKIEEIDALDASEDFLTQESDDLDINPQQGGPPPLPVAANPIMTGQKPFSHEQDKATLVARFTPLVKKIAHHIMGRLPLSVQFEDVVQNGMLGLLDAMNRYQDGMGAQFETYAAQRIRGAILDGLRENDWLTRSARKEMRIIETAIAALSQQLGRLATEQEIANYLKISLAEYHKMLQNARGHQMVYAEDLRSEEDENFLDRHAANVEEVGNGDPLVTLMEKGQRHQLVAAIEHLPEREKLVMSLYYEEEFNLREIGAVLGVTESRVCQLHSQAIAHIRAALTAVERGKGGAR